MELKVEIDHGNMLCHGCLSTGRYLSSISQEYSDLFSKLRHDDSYKIKLELCWECIAFLNKLKEFQTRIITAQSILRDLPYNDRDIKPKSLSSLTSIHINTYNSEFNEDDIEVNDEPKKIFYELQYNKEEDEIKEDNDCHLVDIKTEIECDIKEEYCDTECSDNDNKDDDSDYLPTEIKIESEELKQNKTKKQDKEIKSNYYFNRQKYKMYATLTRQNILFTKKYVKLSKPTCLTPTEYDMHLKNKLTNVSDLKKQLIYKCKQCKSLFLKKRDLLRHTSYFHNKTFPKKCALCSANITSSEHMKDHWTTVHTKMLKCALCAELCRDKDEMKIHINREHFKTYKCNECEEQFGNFPAFVKHYKNAHESCICDMCNATFTNKNNLISHIKLIHTPLHCNICNRNYVNNKCLRIHMATTHPELITKKKTRQKEMNKESSYCVECDTQFVSYTKYKIHLESSAKHTPKKRVPCPECGKTFNNKNFMKKHYDFAHLKVTKYHCDLCDKYYISNGGLQMHITTIHQKISLPKCKICDFCGRGFSTNRILINHRRTHTGERPFQCMYCPAAFAQKYAMKSHQKTQHKTLVNKS